MRASPPAAGSPAGFTLCVHVVLHCIRLEEVHSYRETPSRLKYMTEIRDVLGLDQEYLPDYSTIYKSFDRLKCGCGGRCCAFQRSNTRSLGTPHSTARSLTAAVRRRTSASGRKHCTNAESNDANRCGVARCSRCPYRSSMEA